MEDELGWLRKRKTMNGPPFLPLTGDAGDVILQFTGLPVETESNFTNDDGDAKMEWRFLVNYWDPENKGEAEPRTITENSDNFLACVSELSDQGTNWGKMVNIIWEKRKNEKSKRIFKAFSWACMDEDKAHQFKQAALGE